MTDISTVLKHAKVFRQGAELTRQGTVTLAEGTQTVRVLGLGQSCQTDTVKLYGREGITCSNIRFEKAVTDLDEKIKAINEEITALERKVSIREIQAKLWQDNGDFSSRTVQDPEEIRKYIEKLSERFDVLDSEIRTFKKQIDEKKKEASDLRKESAKSVMVADISALKRGEYPIAVKFFDQKAGWDPLYEIRSDGEGPLSLEVKAEITQGTHEDWDDIDIRLISGSPTTQGTLPELDPIHLHFHEVIARSAAIGGSRNMKLSNMLEDEEAVMGGVDYNIAAPMMMRGTAPVAFGASTVNKDEAYTEYVLSGKRTVKKGTVPTLADLEVHEIPCEYSIVSAPKLDPSAYLVAKVKPADIPIFSYVSASVYYKDVFTGKVDIDAGDADEDIDITLGTEERIKISRKEIARKNSNTLLKAQHITEYGYETRINNNSGEKVTVTIKDQIPVSDEKDITVEPIGLGEGELDKDTGFITKKFDIAGGESTTFKFGYKVTSPKGKHISEF